MSGPVGQIGIDWLGRPVAIEYQWLNTAQQSAPLVVFLHEGLGCLSMWKDFPQRMCEAAGCQGLVYSRPGYGHSTPRAPDEKWAPDFLHRQAIEVLPALFRALAVDPAKQPLWLLGHSDGGSIALLYAAAFPDHLAGGIVLAPHIMVEALSVSSIEKARTAYQTTDLRERLARHHQDPDSAFWGWNNIWLDPAFRNWSIEQDIEHIRCPLLAIQGLNDEYGTLDQIRGIAQRAPQTRLLELQDCGHSPHRDQPERVVEQVSRFICVRGWEEILYRAGAG